MPNIWSANHPKNFWLCQPDFSEEIWQEAILRALPVLQLKEPAADIHSLLEMTLGEGQFGPDRYRFGIARRAYYFMKPLLPQTFTHLLRRIHSGIALKTSSLNWPVETRYIEFLREVLRHAMSIAGTSEIAFRYFWPEGKQFAFVLTHDVETADGQRDIPILADLEESLGFRSSFNFVPERYALDLTLMADLRKRGFEIGVHGLKHDSKLFSSYPVFRKQAKEINHYVREFQSEGFRSPYTHRNPEWMQSLNIVYDLSFFDTDPFEPMPGGSMTIWPFDVGRFLELPYTLPQDSTLFNVLGNSSPHVWLEKISFINNHNGMALLLTHPDYSAKGAALQSYAEVLKEVKTMGGYWHALPREAAAWWKTRAMGNPSNGHGSGMGYATLNGDGINIGVPQ